jgi:hypothetical protein
LRVIDLLQLWASQLTRNVAECVCELRQRSKKDIRLGLGSYLEDEATQVVVLEQTCRVEKTASKITDVDGGKRVRGAGVAVMESSDTCTVT